MTNRSATDRLSTDFYPTPKNVTAALMQYLDLSLDATIWEPACGEGHISKALMEMGYKVVSSELYDRGYGLVGINFLDSTPVEHFDWIITNPPFSLSEQFIGKCIEYQKPFAMLLKSQYWHSQKHEKLFKEYRPKAVLPLTWRPDFLFGKKGGSPTMECIWTVWGTESAESTVYQPLTKPNARGDIR